jgi:hypothetical protein
LRADAPEEGEWCLVEDVEIRVNRMLVTTVKGNCEENLKGARESLLKFVEGYGKA